MTDAEIRDTVMRVAENQVEEQRLIASIAGDLLATWTKHDPSQADSVYVQLAVNAAKAIVAESKKE